MAYIVTSYIIKQLQEAAMAKFKSYNYDQTALAAVDLEKQLPPGSLEFAIHYLVDHEIDRSGLESRFRNDSRG